MLYISVFLAIFVFYAATYGSETAHSKGALALPLILLCLIVGFGDMLGGYDRYIYAEVFDQAANQVTKGLPVLTDKITLYKGYKSEYAYVLWNMFIAHFTENRYIFILATTVFMYVMIYESFKDYIDGNYLFAVLVFMGMWFFFSFTYIRQAMATVVAWYGLRYVERRKPIKFFICALIVYEFHNSGIVYAGLYFLPLRKWTHTQIVSVMLILFIIGATGVTSSLYSLYGGTIDDNRVHGYQDDDTGGRVAYLMEVVVFLYFLLNRYDEIDENNKKDLAALNAALCFCGMLLFFFRSSNAGRQSWYFAMGFIYLFTKLATYQRQPDGYTHWLLVVMFVLFARIVIYWGGQISPYKTFLTNGYRKEDPIIQMYEYDWKYEENKMYRKAWRPVLNNWK